MSEHTPGPWVFMTEAFYGEIRDCETFTEIARMPELDDRPEDFRLIAAAPDLLEACEAALGFVEELEQRGIVADWSRKDQLRAAIDKARGEAING